MPTIANAEHENYNVSVGTSAAEIVATTSDPSPRRQVWITNAHASNTLYVGFGSDMTTANGFPLAAGSAPVVFVLENNVTVYGIASGASTDVRVLVVQGKGDPA